MHHDAIPLKAAALAAVVLTLLSGCGEPVGVPVTFTNERGADAAVTWRVVTSGGDVVLEQTDEVPSAAAHMQVATLQLRPGEHRIFVEEVGFTSDQPVHVDRSTVEISFLLLPQGIEIGASHVD